jgi:alpha-ketoglutarate-dependent taurine dioxygenase
MEIEDLPNFGYVVKELDYSDQNQAVEVKNLVADGRVVIIKNEDAVDPQSLVNFYKNIGRVSAQTKLKDSYVDSYPELVKVRKDGFFSGQEDGELFWHNEILNKTDAEDILSMYCASPADEGGDTLFTDGQTAYADLPEETQKELNEYYCFSVPMGDSTLKNDRMRTLFEKSYFGQIYPTREALYEWVDVNGVPTYTKMAEEKKLISVHPVNNKKGIQFPWTVYRGVNGKSRQESKEIFKFLKDHLLQEKYVYRHKWSKYDICLSDQLHSLHKRDAYKGNRELWRSNIWTKENIDANR